MYSHDAGELADMCIEADLLAFAPQTAWVSLSSL